MSTSILLPLPPLSKPDIRNGFTFFQEHLTTVVPVVLATAVGTFLLCRYTFRRSIRKSKVNQEVNKDSPKVVHSFDIEDIGSKAVYCRCWRSKKFPYCDGAHTKHNEETGDNVGPLIIKKRDA